MCQRMKSDAFIKVLKTKCTKTDVTSVLHYLEMSGLYVRDSKGVLNLDDCYLPRLEFMMSNIQRGDIVYCFNRGIYLVTDINPEASEEHDEFRAMKLKVLPDGQYGIDTRERSCLMLFDKAVRICQSSFDMEQVEKCSYQRYRAYQEVDRVNKILDELRENS